MFWQQWWWLGAQGWTDQYKSISILFLMVKLEVQDCSNSFFFFFFNWQIQRWAEKQRNTLPEFRPTGFPGEKVAENTSDCPAFIVKIKFPSLPWEVWLRILKYSPTLMLSILQYLNKNQHYSWSELQRKLHWNNFSF